jgi:tetratricopeptide (TPR) repeat protein
MSARLLALFVFLSSPLAAQKSDSLMQAQYQQGLEKLSQGNSNMAATIFSQLINSGFSNKEVYVKRGVAYYDQKQFENAKNDFDEAIKARINTTELYEFRGNTKYNLNDYQGAGTDLEKAVSTCVGLRDSPQPESSRWPWSSRRPAARIFALALVFDAFGACV